MTSSAFLKDSPRSDPGAEFFYKNGASSAKLTPDWCRITRRSGAVFPAVKKSAIGELISVVRKHTPQLPGTPSGTCTHDLAIWPHTLLLSYRSVSPRQNGGKANACRHLGKGEKKEKRGYPASCWGGCLRTAPYTRRCPHSGLTHPVSAMG